MTEVTVTVLIGNSDGKLTQIEWSNFVRGMSNLIRESASEVFFFAPSPGDAEWQNAAFVFSVAEGNILSLKESIEILRKSFRQDTVALITGKTEFI